MDTKGGAGAVTGFSTGGRRWRRRGRLLLDCGRCSPRARRGDYHFFFVDGLVRLRHAERDGAEHGTEHDGE